MSYKTKEILAAIGEIIGMLILCYVGYYIYVVVCVSTGSNTGELYHWLGMDYVTAGIKSLIAWVWNIAH